MKALLEHLNREKVDYAITGAVAVSYYGIPRTTLDADFVIHVPSRRINPFIRSLRRVDIDVDLQKVRRQLKSGYNVITVADRRSPHTADLILVNDAPEKREGRIQGIRAHFQSPESLILAKLRMIKATMPAERSQKDRDDVRAILSNTRVDNRKVLDAAKRETTFRVFKQLLSRRKVARDLA